MRIDAIKTGMKHTLFFLLLSGVISAAEVPGVPGVAGVAGVTEEDEEDEQESWYQIEIIVFSNQRESSSSEQWPDQTLQYPEKMLIIGPTLDAQLAPRSLNQLRILQTNQQLSNTNTELSRDEANYSEFLFANPVPNNPAKSKSSLSDRMLEDDLLAGLIREQPPEAETKSRDESVSDTYSGPVEVKVDAEFGPESKAQDIQQPIPDLLFQGDSQYQAYRALPRQEFSLDALARRISGSPSYQLLYHAAWRQPIESMEQAIPVLLQAGNQFDNYSELDGFITISRARYLHLDTDLWFTTFSPRSGQASMVMPDNTQSYAEEDRELLRQYPDINLFESRRHNYLPVQTYRMAQSRRMRSATLHYLDHPAFSLLIRVDRFSFPESVAAIGQPVPQQLPPRP